MELDLITLRLYNWLTYFIIGGLLKRYQFRFKYWIIPVSLVVVNILLQLSLTDFMHYSACSFYYSAPWVVLLSVSIVLLTLSHKFKEDNRLIREMSKIFLLVFTLHSFFIGKVASLVQSTGFIAPLMCWIITSIVTICISWLIMKLPCASKIFRI